MALASILVGLFAISKVKTHFVQKTTESYKAQQTILANQVAETLSNNLSNFENQLQIMATMPEVQNIQNVEQCNTKLNELLKVGRRQLGNLARVDPSGRFACSVNESLIGQDSAQYGSYITDLINDPEHKPVLSRQTKQPGADSFLVGLHVPVFEGETFSGTIGGALYFSKFQDAYLKSVKFGNGGHAVLMDDNADILYHPSLEQNGKNLLDQNIIAFFEPQDTMRKLVKEVKAGRSGTFDYSVQGTAKIGLYKTFKVPGKDRYWAVVVTIPSEDIAQAIDDAGINNVLLALFLLFTSSIALLTFVGLRNIIKNLEVQRMKDDFISITSHQLRTPATVVKQNLGLLMEGYVTNKKDVDEFIASAYESNENQLNIIENILSVSKLEAGRLELQKEKVYVQDLVKQTTGLMKSTIATKKHKLQIVMPAKPITLMADPIKLKMAIENLISNAVKYTPPRGSISINVRNSKENVVIAVKDSGNGISKEDITQIFLRFNRLHSALVSHVPGTGLGLYLTKKIVEMHGGEITVTSKKELGSTFTIKLPLE